MELEKQLQDLRSALEKAENIQTELDRRVYYLRTLYDISKDIFSSVEYRIILKNFLLMTMGNFGVGEGLILILDTSFKKVLGFSLLGFSKDEEVQLRNSLYDILLSSKTQKEGLNHPSLIFTMRFSVNSNCEGFIGLGKKLIEETYNEDDEEILGTLVNNLVVALKNAQSFQKIKSLNKNLVEKNTQLETALKQLKESMRKVEILESVKESLSKFVPVTVSRMIDKSPTKEIPASKRKDLSVLFVDIEGYTRLCEKLGSSQTSEVIEKHFSAFMDAIYINNGDVSETAGDGLMVLFLDKDKETNALEAVQAALAIREKTLKIFEDCTALYKPLDINMGINSGIALVGAVRFETYSGSRWTYTATGSLTNVASRIGSLATGGSIFLSRETADRIKNNFSPVYNGRFDLKNVSEQIEIFRL